jgi:hypothetical protein
MSRVKLSGDLSRNLDLMPAKVESALYALTEYWTPRVEGYAKRTAPWTDRTSNARNGLRAAAEHGGGSHSIILWHTMPYGIWLETRWSGRYAVIIPTVRTQGALIMVQAKNILGRMQ